ncbi:unnamed protein product, partial [Ilex paraguariensis]
MVRREEGRGERGVRLNVNVYAIWRCWRRKRCEVGLWQKSWQLRWVVKAEGGTTDADDESEMPPGKKMLEQQGMAEETLATKIKLDADSKSKGAKEDTEKKETASAVDKELLQAFRFFDRNRVGYIRVEDMRLIIHNLGKFLSHRDVRELVQSALLESNTGRDDRILYNKL